MIFDIPKSHNLNGHLFLISIHLAINDQGRKIRPKNKKSSKTPLIPFTKLQNNNPMGKVLTNLQLATVECLPTNEIRFTDRKH